MYTTATTLALLAGAMAAPVLETRQSCPQIHVFGARETTAPAGYGTAGTVVDLILGANSGATSEAIDYPATGDSSYASSVQAGVQAVTSQVSSFAQSCPDTEIVIVGYSQGAQIFDDALCGGGDPNNGISDTAATITQYNIKAAIFMGDPRHAPGAPYNVGTSSAGGFAARPSGQTCGCFNDKIQSYCDAADPYCSNGSDGATHQSYGNVYGQDALTFVQSML